MAGKLKSAGRLLGLAPAAAEPVPHSYALLTRNV